MKKTETFANRDVSDLIICDYNTGAPFIGLDYANVNTTDITGEVVHAYGGQGHPKKISFSGDRGGTLTVETQVRESKLYKLISGADIDKSAANVRVGQRVYTTATNTFNLDHNPIINSATYSFDVCRDGATVSFSVSSQDITEKTKADGITKYYEVVITPLSPTANDIVIGTELIVYYWRAVATNKIETIAVKSDTFPGAVTIYADTVSKATDGRIIEQKMVVYKAVPQPNFSLSNSNSGDPGTLTMTFDLMEDRDHNILDLIFKNRA